MRKRKEKKHECVTAVSRLVFVSKAQCARILEKKTPQCL
jgi:hypothetical protein